MVKNWSNSNQLNMQQYYGINILTMKATIFDTHGTCAWLQDPHGPLFPSIQEFDDGQ